MNKIGTLKGINVYKIEFAEYVNNRFYKDNKVIYLVGNELIRNNEVIGTYDGYSVTEFDISDRRKYYELPKIKVDAETKINFASTEDILSKVYETDYFSNMIDLDTFLKEN